MTEQTARRSTNPGNASRRRWHDGDTMLSFALFAAVILTLLCLRIADPSNWIAIAAVQVDTLPVDPCGRGGA